ncbi:MAG: MBL fold metallo-hydrolase [Promethearchaeota archaeon]
MENKVKLTFLGGLCKVGGNIVLLEDFGYNVKLLLDFGINTTDFSMFRANFPDINEIKALKDHNILPREIDLPVKNLYSSNFIFDHKKLKYPQKVRECKEKIDPPSNLDGVLISHPHRDHYRGISFLNRNIPIYTGVVTKRIIKACSRSSAQRFENFLYGLKWIKFRTGDIIKLKKMEIYPIHVDHSIPAAYGFIICTSAGIIVYTGDFRMHGHLQFLTADLIKKVKEISKTKAKQLNDFTKRGGKIIALICEGTSVHKGSIESERIVKRHLRKLFNIIPFDYIIVQYERVDWDRFRTYVDIAKKYNWKYIISDKDAYFYNRLNKKAIYRSMKDPNLTTTENIIILSYEKRNFQWKKDLDRLLNSIENDERIISLEDLKYMNKKFFLYITSIQDFATIKKFIPKNLRGAFISSSVDPYSEEYRMDKRFISTDLLDIGVPSYRIHASGHVKPHDLIRFINEIVPKKLIPIHTEHPEFFKKFFKNEKTEVILPIRNIPIEISP